MRKSNYDKRPVLHVRTKGVSAWQGWEAIGAQLRKAIVGKPDAVVCVDCYHGVWESDVLSALTEQLNPSHVFCTAQATLPKEQVNAMLKDHLTDDRVFGIMAHYRIEQFFDMERVAALRQKIALAHGVRLVFGVGAALLCEHPDVLVYADMGALGNPGSASAPANWQTGSMTTTAKTRCANISAATSSNGASSTAISGRCIRILTTCWTPTTPRRPA